MDISACPKCNGPVTRCISQTKGNPYHKCQDRACGWWEGQGYNKGGVFYPGKNNYAPKKYAPPQQQQYQQQQQGPVIYSPVPPPQQQFQAPPPEEPINLSHQGFNEHMDKKRRYQETAPELPMSPTPPANNDDFRSIVLDLIQQKNQTFDDIKTTVLEIKELLKETIAKSSNNNNRESLFSPSAFEKSMKYVTTVIPEKKISE